MWGRQVAARHAPDAGVVRQQQLADRQGRLLGGGRPRAGRRPRGPGSPAPPGADLARQESQTAPEAWTEALSAGRQTGRKILIQDFRY